MDESDPAARPRRRTFTVEYKTRILDEYDALPLGSSERGALLRREGLYTSTALEITGKVHALLEQLSESATPDTKPKP